ncbi:hypothetical protein [Streptomyces sp. LaPpAH-108]|uniref:hypothetical protein n=1 Tax=Streptomyces sp. LaPpAH-108 TaxID=1155714 RepID=UPI001319D500|nr:hypothetical protein [Streptomyces sp. LaPpAH-108]
MARMLLAATPDWHRFLDRLLTDKLPTVATPLTEDVPAFPALVDDIRASTHPTA